MGYSLTGNNGELIKRKIIFAPPEKDAVVKVTNTKDDIIVECAEVVDAGDFVIVRGHLNRSVEYLTTNKEALKKLMGKEDKDDDKKCDEDGKKDNDKKCDEDGKKDNEEKSEKKPEKKRKKEVICEPLCPEPRCLAVDGVVRHTTVWIPFEILVCVQGSKPCDNVIVECISIESLCKGNRIQDIIEDDLIVGVSMNDIINVGVRVESECDCD